MSWGKWRKTLQAEGIACTKSYNLKTTWFLQKTRNHLVYLKLELSSRVEGSGKRWIWAIQDRPDHEGADTYFSGDGKPMEGFKPECYKRRCIVETSLVPDLILWVLCTELCCCPMSPTLSKLLVIDFPFHPNVTVLVVKQSTMHLLLAVHWLAIPEENSKQFYPLYFGFRFIKENKIQSSIGWKSSFLT